MGDDAQWVGWVEGARKGDASAIEQLEQYFAPFVHAVLLSRLAHHAAAPLVKPVIARAVSRLSGLSKDAGFGSWVLIAAREKAAEAGKNSDATVERGDRDPLIAEARQTLVKIRQLAESPRERVLMRLLEGIPGFEIADVVGSAEPEVRAELERAAGTLLQQLTQKPVSFTGDSYLWSLVGTPHPALVPLENQLTALRFDPTAPAPDPDVTPMQAPSPLFEPKKPEGRRPTSENLKPLVADPDHTEPSGGALSNLDEQTQGLPPVAPPSQAAETSNPFAPVARTIGVSDLPAAADFADLLPTAESVDDFDDPKTQAEGGLPLAPKRDPDATLIPATRGDAAPRPTGSKSKISPLPPEPVARPSSPKLPSLEARPSRPSSPRLPALDRPSSPRLPTLDRPSSPRLPALDAKPSRPSRPSAPRLPTLDRDESTLVKPPTPASEAVTRLPGDWRSSEMIGPPLPSFDDETRIGLAQKVVKAGSLARSWRPFAVAVGLMLVALGIGWVVLDGTGHRVRSGWTLVPVMVAAEDLPEGATVTSDLIAQRAVPEQFVTASVIRPDSIQYALGQRILVPVQAGDPLLWSQFESARTNERLSKKVMRHARAFSLASSTAISLGGWIQPSDRVDLIANLRNPETKELVAITLLQDISVLTTGKVSSSTPEALIKNGNRYYLDVSLLLLPEEAQLLALASSSCELQMTLRTEDDHDIINADHRLTEGKTILIGEQERQLQVKRFKTIQDIRNSR